MTALRDTINEGLGACRRAITTARANAGSDQVPLDNIVVEQVRTAKSDGKSGANGVRAPVRYGSADDHICLDRRDNEAIGMKRGKRRPHRAKANFVSPVANPYGQAFRCASGLCKQMEVRHRAGRTAITADAVKMPIGVRAVELNEDDR
jgi:hypothetical protein